MEQAQSDNHLLTTVLTAVRRCLADRTVSLQEASLLLMRKKLHRSNVNVAFISENNSRQFDIEVLPELLAAVESFLQISELL